MLSKKMITLAMMMALFITLPLAAQEEDDEFESMTSMISDLMDVKVSVASKSEEDINDAPGIISVVSRREIEGFAAENLGQILDRVVGANFLSANCWVDNVVHFRGQSKTPYDNHTLILLNGRPLRDPMTGGFNSTVYAVFPIDTIDHLEIIRGPGSVLYGSAAYSGVINIVTREQAEGSSEARVALMAGTQGAFGQQFAGGVNKEGMSFNYGFNHYSNDGPEYEFTDGIGVLDKGNWDRTYYGGFANLNYEGLTINGYYSKFEPYGVGGANLDWIEDNYMNHEAIFIDAGYSYEVNEKFSLDANITFNRHEFVEEKANSTMEGYDFLYELTAKFQPFEGMNVIVGGVVDNTDYSGTKFIDNNIVDTSLYAQFDYKLNENVKLIGGLQWNKPDGIDGNVSPRVGMILKMNEELGIKVLYSSAFRKGYPWETSFYHPVFRGNLDLKPELIDTAEAQIFYKAENHQASATFYYSNMSDIIIRNYHVDSTAPYGFYLKYANGGEHEFYGIELEDKYKVNDNLVLMGSFYYQTNEDDKGVEDATLHPNTMFKVGALYTNEGWNVGVWNSYFGDPTQVPGRPATNDVPEGYSLLSAKISYTYSENLKFAVEGVNLLDELITYPEYTSRGINSLIPLYSEASVFASIIYTIK